MKKRFVSILLTLCMVLTLLPVNVWASESKTALKDPAVTELTVTYNDGEIDKTISLLPEKSNQTQIPLPADGQLTFQIRFDNWDQLDKVYVTSAKDDSVKYLEAVANGTDGCYTASGCFDSNDISYVPGKINIEYTKKTDNVKIGNNVDWSTLQAALENYCTTTVSSCSGETAQAAVDISKLLGAEEDVVINFVIDMFDETTGSDLNSWLGAYKDLENAKKYALDGGNYFLYMDYTDPASYAMIVHDLSGNKYIKLIVDDVGQSFSSMSKVAEKLSQINSVSSLAYDYFEIKNSADELRKEIAANSSLSPSQKLQLNSTVDDYETDRRAFALLTTILPTVVAATGGTMAGPAIVFTALLGAINAAADTFWDYRIGMIRGCEEIDSNFVDSSCGMPLTWDILSDGKGVIRGILAQSGHYSFTEDGPASVIVGDDGIPVNVTLCIHGKEKVGIRISSGSVLNLCDCKYVEGGENSPTKAVGVGMDSGCELILNSGIIGDYGSGAYGSGSNLVVSSDSKLIVENGTITYGIHAEEDSEIIINGGIVNTPKLIGHYEHSIWSYTWANSNIEIHGGQLTGAIRVYDSTENESNKSVLHIDDGLVGGISVDNATLTIDGGTVVGLSIGDNCMATISEGMVISPDDNSASIMGVTNNGNLKINGGNFIGGIKNNKNGVLNIFGGTFPNTYITNAGNASICNASFQSLDGTCIRNDDGIMVINSGTFQGGRYAASNTGTDRNGTLTINGGKFYGAEAAVSNRIGDIIISGGYFHGPIGINTYPWDCKTSLLINSNSVIEIDATESASSKGHLSPQLPIDAVADYNGGVTYYSPADATGIKMTIEEAAEIDYTQPYVCLVADEATKGPSGGNKEECEHNYIISAVTASTCTERGYTIHTCDQCGDSYRDTFTDALGHSYGEWVVTATATSITAGQRERICSRCNNKETEIIPATGGGSSSGGNSSSSSSGGNSSSSNYNVDAPTHITGGSIQVSSSGAIKGEIVAITAIPDSGYELSALIVTDSNGKELTLTDGGNGKYTFTMPNGKVSVDAVFRTVETLLDSPFTDVAIDEWYYDAVKFMAENGLMNGVSNGIFDPDANMSRAMLIQILYNKESNPNVNVGSIFSDIATGAWYTDAVSWASEKGIVDGYGNGMFGPNDDITREQFAAMLYRYAGSPTPTDLSLNFSDAYEVSDWAHDAVSWAVEQGILTGNGNGLLNPTGSVTRAEAAQMIQYYLTS